MEHRSNNTHQCFACGTHRHEADMRPFGHDEHLGVVSWVCHECRDDRVIAGGRPHLKWATVARAERLAAAGLGWSPDQVMRRGLALLEAEHAQREGGKA